MVAVWDFTTFWQFNIIFCSILDNHASDNVNIKHTRMTSLTSLLSGCYLLSLLRPMLPSVGGNLPSPLIAIFYMIGKRFVIQTFLYKDKSCFQLHENLFEMAALL